MQTHYTYRASHRKTGKYQRTLSDAENTTTNIALRKHIEYIQSGSQLTYSGTYARLYLTKKFPIRLSLLSRYWFATTTVDGSVSDWLLTEMVETVTVHTQRNTITSHGNTPHVRCSCVYSLFVCSTVYG